MNYILTGIRSFLVLSSTGFWITLLFLESLVLGKTTTRGYKYRRRWAKSAMFLLGIKVEEVVGKIDITNALVISNHRTLLDPVVQCAFIEANIIAKAEVGNLPVISQGAQMTGIIFVKREKLRSRLAARETTKDILVNGGKVLVYAEGTTGTNRHSEKFKPGTFSIAAEENIPVIPVAIEYPEKKDYWFQESMGKQMLGQIGTWRTRVKVRIGAPITHADPLVLLEKTQGFIDSNLLEMQKDWSNIFTNES